MAARSRALITCRDTCDCTRVRSRAPNVTDSSCHSRSCSDTAPCRTSVASANVDSRNFPRSTVTYEQRTAVVQEVDHISDAVPATEFVPRLPPAMEDASMITEIAEEPLPSGQPGELGESLKCSVCAREFARCADLKRHAHVHVRELAKQNGDSSKPTRMASLRHGADSVFKLKSAAPAKQRDGENFMPTSTAPPSKPSGASFKPVSTAPIELSDDVTPAPLVASKHDGDNFKSVPQVPSRQDINFKPTSMTQSKLGDNFQPMSEAVAKQDTIFKPTATAASKRSCSSKPKSTVPPSASFDFQPTSVTPLKQGGNSKPKSTVPPLKHSHVCVLCCRPFPTQRQLSEHLELHALKPHRFKECGETLSFINVHKSHQPESH